MGRMVVLSVVVALCVVGCKEKKRRPTSRGEAQTMLKQLYDGARAYYAEASTSRGITPAPKQFPEPSAGPTPPLGACCEGGADKCAPKAELWKDPTWAALKFSIDKPHYYSYQYIVKDKTKEFTVRAHADLDCDGEYSTFEMHGQINPAVGEGVVGGQLYRENEIE